MNLNVNPNELENIVCDNCDSEIFEQNLKIKHVPKVISPNGQEGYINLPLINCKGCGKDLNEILDKLNDKGVEWN